MKECISNKNSGYNYELKEPARDLRKNMTEQERKLWFCFLRQYPIKFRRQRPIGHYIVDFYCSKARLAIEIDGSQHYTTTESEQYDLERTHEINKYGVQVIRFSNHDVNTNFEGVCIEIDKAVCDKVGCERHI